MLFSRGNAKEKSDEKQDLTSKLEALHEVLTRVRVPPAYNPGKWFAGPINFAPAVRAGMNLPERVEICDVTLREASQAYFGKKEFYCPGP
jgi:hypothetical protein